MRKFILLLVLVPLLQGCPPCCKNISAHVYLKFQNGKGEDLLDPRTPNALNAEEIEVFVVRNGARVRLLNYTRDAPKNFKIYGSSKEQYHMKFFFDIAQESFVKKKVTMFITYEDGSEDKLVGEFNDNDGPSVLLQSLWINDVPKGRPSHLPSDAFVINK